MMSFRCAVAAAGTLVALAVMTAGGSAPVSAIAGALSMGSADAEVGTEVSVPLEASVPSEPGLGAWTVDVHYDGSVVSVAGCDGGEANSICNPEFGDDVVRVTGANALGIEDDAVLSNVTFECLQPEASPLALFVQVFADGTTGGPQDIDVQVTDGEISCLAQLQPSPTPTSPSSTAPTPTQAGPTPTLVPGTAVPEASPSPAATVTPESQVLGVPGAGSGGRMPWYPNDLRGWAIACLAGAGVAWLIAGFGSIWAAGGAGNSTPRRGENGFVPRLTPRGKPMRNVDGSER